MVAICTVLACTQYIGETGHYFFPCRQLFNVLTYVFMFFNVIFGFVMCFLRVFGVLIFTCVMLFRLDWDVYMRGLEGWDMG